MLKYPRRDIMKRKVLAILPISIGGRLTTSSIIDGLRQNDCIVTVFDELYDKNLQQVLQEDFDTIVGYDFSAIKTKTNNNLKTPTISYFSDNIREKTSGADWADYIKYLEDNSPENNNYIFYWDKELTKQETIKNIHYLPHFVNFDIYKDLKNEPKYDIMFAGRLDTDYRLNFFEQLIDIFPHKKFAWFAIEKHFQDALNRCQNPEKLKKSYQGFIDNETDMANAINNSKIVFNINAQGISSLNYRTFQTIACKRLLISDYREELNLFKGHLPFYKDINDLAIQIEYFLNNTEAYRSVTEQCFEICKQNHNSKKCTKIMLNTSKIHCSSDV